MAQSTTSAYASYQAEKNVTGVGLFLTNDLVEAMRAIRPDTKDATIVREAVVHFLNHTYAGQIEPRTFALPTKPAKKSKDEQIKELQAQVEALKSQVAPPTPPTQIADAKTGKVTEKAA